MHPVTEIYDRICDLAEKFCPEYPDIKEVSHWEKLYAIEQGFQGTLLANQDVHREWKETKEALASALAEVEELKDGLSDAIQHLDYCGWGRDAWERECAEETRNKLSILQAKYSL
jgi:hypothetical protein